MSKICIYEIPEAPYLAVSSVRSERRRSCVIEDTTGRLRRVNPIYIGPADNRKILQLGRLMSRYTKNLKYRQDLTRERIHEIFGINPTEYRSIH